MVASCLCIIDDHAVFADKAVYQGLDIDGAHAGLAVGNDDPRLHDVPGGDFGGQAFVDDLHVHPALCDLAALKTGSLYPRQDREDSRCHLHVVDTLIAVAKKSPGRAAHGAQHPFGRRAVQPCVDILCQQVRVFREHPVIVGCRDVQVRAKLAVGDGANLQRLHGFRAVIIHMEVDLAVAGIHLQVPGVHQVIFFQFILPRDLSGHFLQGKTFFHSRSLLSFLVRLP